MPDGYRPRNYHKPSDSSVDKQQKFETEISLDFNNFPLDNIGDILLQISTKIKKM